VLRASLSGLLSYRGRLTATVLAIVLGVGFVTGTLVFTDALRTTFYDRFAQAERGVDAAVTARDDGRLDETALDAARAVPGVAVAEPRLADRVRILDRDGPPHAPDRRERTLGISVASDPRLRWQDATSGRLPAAAGEVAVDAATTQQLGLREGDSVRIAAEGRVETFTFVGTVDPGLGAAFLNDEGGGVAAIPTESLRRLLGARGYDRIDLVAGDGVGQAALRRDAAEALGGAPSPCAPATSCASAPPNRSPARPASSTPCSCCSAGSPCWWRRSSSTTPSPSSWPSAAGSSRCCAASAPRAARSSAPCSARRRCSACCRRCSASARASASRWACASSSRAWAPTTRPRRSASPPQRS